jgi:hypothetical protein
MIATRLHRLRPCAVSVLGLLFAGCVTRQLEPDFATFSEAYAHDLNWQMLLNLARLDQGHPAYFMAIGEIRIGRSQSGSLNAAGTSNHTTGQTVTTAVSRTVSNVLSGTLTPNGAINTSPTFVFIPINSEEASRQLLSPISIDVFNTLYEQGWPVDQLLRVLVERIELEQPDGKHIVLTNSPTRAASPDSFTRFLRACEMVRELQQRGGLQLLVEEVEIPSVVSAERAESPDKNQSGRRGGISGETALKTSAGVAGGESGASSDAANHKRKTETEGATKRRIYRFSPNPLVLEAVLDEFGQDPRYVTDNALANFREVFHSTLTVGSGTTVDSAHDAAGRRVPHSTLVLRSFRNVLDAVAQEQRAFDALAQQNPTGFLGQIPRRQQQPVLRTDWSGKAESKKLLHPVISLTYAGNSYQITDDANRDITSLDARWNRDVFRLLIDLSSQVTVDITKFQRQVLELTP